MNLVFDDWLGYVVRGTGGQCFDADVGVSLGQGRSHDDLDGLIDLEQFGQCGHPIHDRHFYVQHDNVDWISGQAFDSGLSVTDRRDNRNGGIGLERTPKYAANDRRIVDDHDPNWCGFVQPCCGNGCY